jgi:hypothetical protein
MFDAEQMQSSATDGHRRNANVPPMIATEEMQFSYGWWPGTKYN